jgi:hypothetical protein
MLVGWNENLQLFPVHLLLLGQYSSRQMKSIAQHQKEDVGKVKTGESLLHLSHPHHPSIGHLYQESKKKPGN